MKLPLVALAFAASLRRSSGWGAHTCRKPVARGGRTVEAREESWRATGAQFLPKRLRRDRSHARRRAASVRGANSTRAGAKSAAAQSRRRRPRSSSSCRRHGPGARPARRPLVKNFARTGGRRARKKKFARTGDGTSRGLAAATGPRRSSYVVEMLDSHPEVCAGYELMNPEWKAPCRQLGRGASCQDAVAAVAGGAIDAVLNGSRAWTPTAGAAGADAVAGLRRAWWPRWDE